MSTTDQALDYQAIQQAAVEVLSRSSAVIFSINNSDNAAIENIWLALRRLDRSWDGRWSGRPIDRAEASGIAEALSAGARRIMEIDDSPVGIIMAGKELDKLRDTISTLHPIQPEISRDVEAERNARRRYVLTCQAIAQRLSGQPRWTFQGKTLEIIKQAFQQSAPLSLVYHAMRELIKQHPRDSVIVFLYYSSLERLIDMWRTELSCGHRMNPYTDIPPDSEIDVFVEERCTSDRFIIESGRWGK